MKFRRLLLLVAVGLLVLERARADEPLSFEKDVRPIFKAYCLDCHGGAEKLEGDLDLRLARFAARGGLSGPAIEPGASEESYLLMRVHDGEMPPGEKKVPADQVAVIERWIAGGAITLRQEPESLPPGIDITPEERAYWAFQPITRPQPPEFTAAADRVRTPVDAFVLSKLRERGLSFAPEADRLTLLRRASADLTGLSPSQQEIDAYLNDKSPDAYERMIDRLLASPHYGERWGRHWLDVAGYADSEGNGSEDTPRPYAYKYRDYVIRALNADKPLDQFAIEQLAGDELVPRPWSKLGPQQVETLAATGFLRMAVDGTTTGADDEPLAANQVVADTIKIVSSAFLGLTVGCAQCHDHRYDPIPQVDYFRLRAVFEPALDPSHWRRPAQRLLSLYTDEQRATAAAVETQAGELQKTVDVKTKEYLATALTKELEKFPEDQREVLRQACETAADKLNDDQKALLAANPSLNINAGNLYQYNAEAAKELEAERAKVAAERAKKPVEDFVSLLSEQPDVVPETRVFHRGDHRQPTQAVGPGDLTIAAPDGARFEIDSDDSALPSTGRRLSYARHLMSGRHPLVGRVLANRIWLHHMGRGLVDTPGDFGVLGQRPTHPELLDWLADELARQGWSLKAMHRLIMTSSVYRQSSQRQPSHDAVDSSNTLYGRYPVRRLDAEVLRDRILAVSGRLDLTPFGPPVAVAEDAVGQVMPAEDSARRSIYLEARRTKPVSLLDGFDAPVMAVNCERRNPSTSAPQSLMLMNSDFILGHAQKMAERLMSESPTDPPECPGETDTWKLADHNDGDSENTADALWPRWVARAWNLAYQRPIRADEIELVRSFVVTQRATLDGQKVEAKAREKAVLTNLCQQLLSSNEFLYVE